MKTSPIKEKVKKQFTADELEAARLARNAYMRAWRKKNPEKVHTYDLKHWQNVGQAIIIAAAAAEGGKEI